MRLLVEGVPIAGGIVGAGGEIAWPKPTRPGAVLHVESEIIESKTITISPGPRRGNDPQRNSQSVRRDRAGVYREARRAA